MAFGATEPENFLCCCTFAIYSTFANRCLYLLCGVVRTNRKAVVYAATKMNHTHIHCEFPNRSQRYGK